MDVGSWLRALGLGRYEPAFIENAIDSDVLPELTEGDLKKLGIPLGDRKRLVKAIKAITAGSPSAFTTSAVGGNAQSGQAGMAGAERRHLTVMICDLVGSTALSARLDPEDMRAVMDAYHAACARIVQAYDGFLGDFRGDARTKTMPSEPCGRGSKSLPRLRSWRRTPRSRSRCASASRAAWW